ncbi:rod shape-determining protein MreD [Longibacter salinarum]|uniref:Rod shape-determining protein MreD n=1 Tax=Longibacter salinarum TaxID=1850348 RepID=A0A2A8CYX5_9BACT|nr:rod shape-determining protein MreD [Longibacter salinarum]PEN13777.1 rod shape-determining protein MreD [Longibacter salinarum]
MPTRVRHLLFGAATVLTQWLVLGRLTVWGAYPDVVLLFIAWFSLRTSRRQGAIAGFSLGLVLDAIYGTWGIHAFVKTVIGFLLGFFAVDERDTITIQPTQAFMGGLVIALVHNGLLIAFLALQTDTANDFLVLSLWFGSALYTACIAGLLNLFG